MLAAPVGQLHRLGCRVAKELYKRGLTLSSGGIRFAWQGRELVTFGRARACKGQGWKGKRLAISKATIRPGCGGL